MLLQVLALIALVVPISCYHDKRIITTLKYSKFRVKPTIVNGYPANLGDVPFMVSIKEKGRYFKKPGVVYANLCGGSIIAINKVLSAAHCFESSNFYYKKHPEFLRVVAGNLHNLAEEDTGDKLQQWRRVKRVVVHRNFHFPVNDIALAYTYPNWDFCAEVNYIPIATSDEYLNNCITAGFGRLGFKKGDTQSPVLLLADINMMPPKKCSKIYGMDMSSFICTSSAVTDVAQGDSGGPLVCEALTSLDSSRGMPEVTGRKTLVGVVSGKNFDKTTLFTRVPAYRSWIQTDGATELRCNILLMIFMLVSYCSFISIHSF